MARNANSTTAVKIENRLLSLTIACLLLILSPMVWAQTLGTTNLLEASTAGSDSVVLSANATWTATSNASWLHLSVANQSGTASTNVIFSFDANPGATRSGTLTIDGQTLTVTQAGSTYVAANPLTTLVSSGLRGPDDVAVDGAGNVYIADAGNNAVKEWNAASNTVTTLVSSGLNNPHGVTVDGVGNVYIADSGNNTIKEWTAASNTVTTLVSSELNLPVDVAVDSTGNVYIADYGNNAIKEWLVASNSVTTVVSSGISQSAGVAVDAAGNVFIAKTAFWEIAEWTAANHTVTTLVPVSSGLRSPHGLTVDGAGNVYIADSGNEMIKKWTASSHTVTTLASLGLSFPGGVAVDGAGDVYIADSANNVIEELPHAFVDPTGKLEGPAAGSDVLPVVLPSTANLTGPFLPGAVNMTGPFQQFSDSDWLTVTGSTNGVVSFSFTANNSATNRVAYIILLGQLIPVTQVGSLNLTDLTILSDGTVQFSLNNIFTNATFTVLSSSNLLLPLTNWTVLGSLTNNGSGQCQFTDLTATNGGQRFYRVSSP